MGWRSTLRSTFRGAVGLFLAGGALSLILFGPRASSQVPEDRVVVTYWEKWTGFEAEAMITLIQRFNETVGSEEGIYVEYVPTTGVDLKTLVAVSGGDPPDLVGLWQRNLHSFAAAAALHGLDEYISTSSFDPQALLPVFRDGCRYHDRYFAVPLTPASIALYYNEDILDQYEEPLRAVGLESSRPPRTIAELDAFADVVQRRNAAGDLEMVCFLPGLPEDFGWFWNAWPVWFGGRLLADGQDRFRVDQPSFVEAYTWLAHFMRRFGGADLVRFEQSLGPYDSEDNPFLQGQVVMMLQGPWFANLIRQRAGKLSYGVAPVPTLDGSEAGFCEQDILAIPSGAKHGRQAWRFIEWLYTAPPFCLNGNRRSTAWLLSGGPLPTETGGSSLALRPIEWLCWMHCKDFPLVEPLSAAVQTHPNPAIEVHERIARSPNIQMIPALPNWPELETEFRAAYRDIIMTDVEPGARLRACQARIDELTRLAEIRLQRYGLAYP